MIFCNVNNWSDYFFAVEGTDKSFDIGGLVDTGLDNEIAIWMLTSFEPCHFEFLTKESKLTISRKSRIPLADLWLNVELYSKIVDMPVADTTWRELLATPGITPVDIYKKLTQDEELTKSQFAAQAAVIKPDSENPKVEGEVMYYVLGLRAYLWSKYRKGKLSESGNIIKVNFGRVEKPELEPDTKILAMVEMLNDQFEHISDMEGVKYSTIQ